jgi:ABC-type sugar transport system ATPase subunit
MAERFAPRNGFCSMQNEVTVLQVDGLVKAYSGVRALRGVSVDLRRG